MRRVAMVSEHASPLAVLGGEDAGGQNVYVDEVSRGVARLGFEVDIFTRRDSSDLPEVVEVDQRRRVIHLTAGPIGPLKKDDFWPHMPQFRDQMLDFAARTGTRYDVIHANFWMSAWAAVEAAPTLGAPVVVTFHANGEEKRRLQGAADTSPKDRVEVERRIVRKASKLIAQCPVEASQLLDWYGADPSKVVVIPSAVDAQVFQPVDKPIAKRDLGWPEGELVVLYVGRVLPRKGIDNLIRALPELRKLSAAHFRLAVVGGESRYPDPARDPEMRRLMDLARSLGVESLVEFVGNRPSKELFRYYSAADAFASTPWYEPFGLTPLEAMACGTPAVVSRVGGMKHTVLDGETGYLVEPNDPEGLAAKLADLLADAPRRAAMGRAARARVEAEFTWPTVALRVADLYRSLIGPGALVTAGSGSLVGPARKAA